MTTILVEEVRVVVPLFPRSTIPGATRLGDIFGVSLEKVNRHCYSYTPRPNIRPSNCAPSLSLSIVPPDSSDTNVGTVGSSAFPKLKPSATGCSQSC
jgi:hypothetical protein